MKAVCIAMNSPPDCGSKMVKSFSALVAQEAYAVRKFGLSSISVPMLASLDEMRRRPRRRQTTSPQ